MKNQREIYEALLAGETVVNSNGTLVSLTDDGFLTDNWAFGLPENWSIKPKPIEFWINVYETGVGLYHHKTKEEAKDSANPKLLRTIKMVEEK